MERKMVKLIIIVFLLLAHFHTETEICVRTYNSDANKKDTIEVDYLVIGGR